MVSLRYLGQPEEILNVAGGFGGGLGQGDLCGLLTGGMMAIGLSAGMIHKERSEFSRYGKKIYKEYWDWWVSCALLHCSELRPKIVRGESNLYISMCRRVAAKMEGLIKPAKA